MKWCSFTVCRRPVSGPCPAIRRVRVSQKTDSRDQCENHDGRSGHNIVERQTPSFAEDCKPQPVRCGSSGDNTTSVHVPSSCRVERESTARRTGSLVGRKLKTNIDICILYYIAPSYDTKMYIRICNQWRRRW